MTERYDGFQHFQTNVSRRRVLQVGGLSALGLLIAGYSDESKGANSKDPKPEHGQPVRGGTLRFATHMEISTLDPAFSVNYGERFALYAIYNTLVGYDLDFNVVPELAEKWNISNDGKKVTFHLRSGVEFHDGTPFNAAAVKWNLDRILDKKTNSPLRSDITPPLDTVRVIDDLTVELDLTSPSRPLLAVLGDRPGFIVSPTAVKKYGDEFGIHPVGTGAFEFVSFKRDRTLALKRFKKYWDSEHVYLDKIVFNNVPDSSVQLTRLRTGGADICDPITPQLAITVQGAGDVALTKGKTGSWYAVQMDCDKPPFNDPRLRQAIAYSSNREGIKGALFLGEARVATGPVGNGWAYNSSDTTPIYEYNMDKAKALVREADAVGRVVKFTNSSQSDYQLIVQLVQRSYKETGLRLDTGTVPASDYYDDVVADKIGWSVTKWTPRADPDGLLRKILYSTSPSNTVGYKNLEVDRLLDKAATIFDTKKAAPIYYKVCKILEKDAPYVWFVYPNEIVPHRSAVAGFNIYPDTVYRLQELWFKK